MQTKEEVALVKLISAWKLLCPKKYRDKFDELITEMVKGGTTDMREQCRVIVGRLWDGLTYGNWPSVTP